MSRAAIAAIVVLCLAAACEEITTVEETPHFDVEIGVASDILSSTGDTLVGDTVVFTATVARDGAPYAFSDPIFVSADPNVVRVLDAATGRAVLAGTGRTEVAVRFDGSRFPDSLLHAQLVVPVDSFRVAVSAAAPSLQGGLALVGDTVRFEATVLRSDGREIARADAPSFSSSNPAVIRFVDSSRGRAVLERPGRAAVTARFDGIATPAGPLAGSIDLEALDLSVRLSMESLHSGRVAEGDTLVTDSVQFGLEVLRNGEPIEVQGTTFETSHPGVVTIVDPQTGRAAFADTGSATVTGRFTSPELPLQEATLPLRVTTYRLTLSAPEQPVMGDTVTFGMAVVATRTGEELASDPRYTSSNERVVELIDPDGGRAFIRDLGVSEVRVTLDEPTLPHAALEAAVTMQVGTERFYGAVQPDEGDFGAAVELAASEVHRFTSATEVIFEGDVVGFIEGIDADAIELRVPAGAGSGPVVLRNLIDDEGALREEVRSRWSFAGAGTVEDEYEPNDAFPLRSDLEIQEARWVRLLSIDPQKVSPADTDFFYFRLPFTRVVRITAEWQQEADVDFIICFGSGDPPQDYFRSFFGTPICSRSAGANSRGGRVEDATMVLSAGIHVVAFYCVECPSVPLTYRARIQGAR